MLAYAKIFFLEDISEQAGRSVLSKATVDFKAISEKLFNFEVDVNGERVKWLHLKRLCLGMVQPSVTFGYDYDPANTMTWSLTKKVRKVYPLPVFSDIPLKQAYST